jgi:hypothetical protein
MSCHGSFGKKIAVTFAFVLGGVLLAGCTWSSSATAHNGDATLEAAGCKLISLLPQPSPDSSEFVSLPPPLFKDFTNSGNQIFVRAMRKFHSAARSGNSPAMIKALNSAAEECNRLDLATDSAQ